MHLDTLDHERMRAVLANLNPDDEAELDAAGRDLAVDGFRVAIGKSPVLGAVMHGGEPVCAFGVTPDGRDPLVGVPWMVSTPEFRRHPRAAAEFSRQVIEVMRDAFPRLHNIVHVEHLRAISWLQWLGFDVDTQRPCGPGNAFFYFTWSRDV